MKVHFYIRYRTQYGESLLVSGNCPELGNDHPDRALALEYLHDDLWHGAAELGKKMPATLTYRYHHCDSAGQVQTEWDKDRHLQLSDTRANSSADKPPNKDDLAKNPRRSNSPSSVDIRLSPGNGISVSVKSNQLV